MNLTRAARSLLADPRHGFASVLTVMFLVLTILGVQAACAVHLDEAVEQHALPAAATVSDQATQADPEHPGEDPTDCAEDTTVTARYDRTLSPSMDFAGLPSLAVQWQVPEFRYDGARAPSGEAVAAAPSLHALGISRT
ncbi:hypothetical protein [Promicromonospora soli]